MTKDEKIKVLEDTLKLARLLLWRDGDEGQILPLPPEYYELEAKEYTAQYLLSRLVKALKDIISITDRNHNIWHSAHRILHEAEIYLNSRN